MPAWLECEDDAPVLPLYLSLWQFSQVQESLIENRMDNLRKKARTGDSVAQTNLRIFCALVRSVQVGSLTGYFAFENLATVMRDWNKLSPFNFANL